MLETGTKIASEAKFINLLTSIQEIESSKLGMARRANKEMKLTLRKKKIQEIALTGRKLSNGSTELFDTVKKSPVYMWMNIPKTAKLILLKAFYVPVKQTQRNLFKTVLDFQATSSRTK